MPSETPFLAPAHRSPHLLFAIFGLASMALFWVPLHQLIALSLADPRYSHLVAIPGISAFFLYRERHKIFSRIVFRPAGGLPLLAATLAMYGLLALRAVRAPTNYTLSLAMLSIILVWAAGFAVCDGVEALRAARFPFLLLLLLVPIPFDLMEKIVTVLQRGSAEATYAFFRLADVPMFRDGTRFELPGIGVQIAKECSSIHSSWALFITGLLLGHLFLKLVWGKVCLCVLTVPIAMLTNAVRIVTIWFLGTHVNVGFFYGNLHRNGGNSVFADLAFGSDGFPVAAAKARGPRSPGEKCGREAGRCGRAARRSGRHLPLKH